MDSKPFKDADFLKNPSGVILMDGKEVAHTRQCCHCGQHFLSIKGSGKRRGYCTYCNKITCGAHKCDVCVPMEEKLALAEGMSLRKSKFKDKVLLLSADGTPLL